MTEVYGKAVAMIEEGSDDSKFGLYGGFTAVLSTQSEDRDFESLKRSDWIEPLPTKCTLDADHGMSVADTIGSFVPYFEGDVLMMDAKFASTAKAQEVRTLINEGHVSTVSVAFMTHKTKKGENEPFRELLNAGVVAVPSNRDAVILASKAAHALRDAFSDATEGDVPEDVKAAVMNVLSPENGHWCDSADCHSEKAIEVTVSGGGGAGADAKDAPTRGSLELRIDAALKGLAAGALTLDEAHELVDLKSVEKKDATIFMNVLPRLDSEAFKNALVEIWTKAGATASGVGETGALVQAIHDAASHLGALCPVLEPEVDPDSGASSGANKEVDEDETFVKRLDEVLTPKSVVESPEAPAPTDEVPAPASPDDDSDAALKARAMKMSLALTTPID